jgi:hypothetical protein
LTRSLNFGVDVVELLDATGFVRRGDREAKRDGVQLWQYFSGRGLERLASFAVRKHVLCSHSAYGRRIAVDLVDCEVEASAAVCVVGIRTAGELNLIILSQTGGHNIEIRSGNTPAAVRGETTCPGCGIVVGVCPRKNECERSV